MFELKIPLHTVVILVGAKGSEKRKFAQTVLIHQLQQKQPMSDFQTTVQFFSFDDKKELEHGSEEVESNKVAHPILVKEMKKYMKFPMKAEFIVVETEFLTSAEQEEIRKQAERFEYQIVVIILDDMQRTKYSNFSKKKYHQIYYISEKKWLAAPQKYTVTIPDIEEYLSCLLEEDKKYLLVGDIHECLPELIQLLGNVGYRITPSGEITGTDKILYDKIILIGDFVDKGNRTAETIEFLYKNREHFIFVLGNHENFVYKYLIGELPREAVSENSFNQYFTSILVLEKDPALFAKFESLMNLTKPFVHFIGKGEPSFYATHAPCKNKYIGKLSKRACRKQRNFILNRSLEIEPQLQFIEKEANNHDPFHFFGHVATKKVIRIKNQIGLDTGCAAGNLLTAATISGGEIQYYSVESTTKHLEAELPILFSKNYNLK